MFNQSFSPLEGGMEIVEGFCNSNNNNKTITGINHDDQDDDHQEDMEELRRGPWTVEEDFKLINYIASHGEGRWNSLARCAGLKRTGKSCRLRWLNYLRPDVRRGNITLEEQLLILELHSRWGNRWSKIAQHLPGRTDNEIKNYWRTRVQKHAKQLKCDVNSKQFKDTMRYLWMPRLVERIQAAAAATGNDHRRLISTADNIDGGTVQQFAGGSGILTTNNNDNNHYGTPSYTPENSSTAASSSEQSFGAQVSPGSELTDYYTIPVNDNPNTDNYFQANNGGEVGYSESLVSTCGNYFNGGLGFEGFDQMDCQPNHNSNNNGSWSFLDSLWNVDDAWFSQQPFNM